MTDYSKMSDVEISLAVGKLVSRDGLSVVGHSGKAFIHYYSEPTEKIGEFCLGWKEFDPCNSWADAGPIIAKSHIAIIWLEHEEVWEASASYVIEEGCWDWESEPSHYHLDASPLRAAMIVFLMMKDAEKEQGNG